MMADALSRGLDWYQDSFTIPEMVGSHHLMPPEAAILSKFRSEFQDKRILDIGVGGGRTLPFLTEISGNYTAIDRSERMVAVCRERYPNAVVKMADVCNLSDFPDGSIDAAFFSFNGIDILNHNLRQKAFSEIRRVLAPEGFFVFSSHNRAAIERLTPPWHLSRLPININPLVKPIPFLKKCATFTLGIANNMLLRRQEYDCDQYCLVNDGASKFSVILYYIAIEEQIKQIQEWGFSPTAAVGSDGRWLAPSDYASCKDFWIYYVCRRQ